MSTTVCVSANTLSYPQGGGHMWVYLNWALGLRSIGCKVLWVEGVVKGEWIPGGQDLSQRLADLKARLAPYGLANHVVLWTAENVDLQPDPCLGACLPVDAVTDADLLLNINYHMPTSVVARFRRSALVDIDPGLLQTWVSDSAYNFALPRHDVYFTIGETVGQPGAKFPDLGIKWLYTPPCVSLDSWPLVRTEPPAPLTTVSHWYSGDWLRDDAGELVSNEKRTGFMQVLGLPRLTSVGLELALQLRENDEDDRVLLLNHGWRVRDAWAVTGTPWDYQRYVQASLGEFSCVKPSCVRFQNAWISDRTLCYLATGKPAVIEHTGASRFLPEREGLFRFRDLSEAVQCLKALLEDYERHCRLARGLAENYFDAKKVVTKVLERSL